MTHTAHNGISATPYGNIGRIFAEVFDKLLEKEKPEEEKEKTTISFMEGVEHVFPSFADNMAKAFSYLTETNQEDQLKSDSKVVVQITSDSQATGGEKDKPNS